jgi:hypothetical protein
VCVCLQCFWYFNSRRRECVCYVCVCRYTCVHIRAYACTCLYHVVSSVVGEQEGYTCWFFCFERCTYVVCMCMCMCICYLASALCFAALLWFLLFGLFVHTEASEILGYSRVSLSGKRKRPLSDESSSASSSSDPTLSSTSSTAAATTPVGVLCACEWERERECVCVC